MRGGRFYAGACSASGSRAAHARVRGRRGARGARRCLWYRGPHPRTLVRGPLSRSTIAADAVDAPTGTARPRDVHDRRARARVRAHHARHPLLRGLRPRAAGPRRPRAHLRRARAGPHQADPARQAPRAVALGDRRAARPVRGGAQRARAARQVPRAARRAARAAPAAEGGHRRGAGRDRRHRARVPPAPEATSRRSAAPRAGPVPAAAPAAAPGRVQAAGASGPGRPAGHQVGCRAAHPRHRPPARPRATKPAAN